MNIERIIDRGYYWIDENARKTSLALARKLSRRHFLSRLGMIIAGAAAFPLLPVARSFAQSSVEEVGDPQSCEYWRYCAMSGTLCSCCGGSYTSCPNPTDNRNYLMSYNDCCGKSVCSRCSCHNTEGDKPVYFNSNSSTVLWCFGTENTSYHCTVSLVLGTTDE